MQLLFLNPYWQETSAPTIHSPLVGQALQGIVQILGSTATEGFQSSEVSFAYFINPTDTWFLISESDVQVENGNLAEWDTTTISDGDYTLRLVVSLDDGSELVTTVEGIRVRNYSPVETDTPAATVPQPTLKATETSTRTPTPSITPIPSSTPFAATSTAPPPNPAEVSQNDVIISFMVGVLYTFGLFALLGILYGIQALIRRR